MRGGKEEKERRRGQERRGKREVDEEEGFWCRTLTASTFM